MTSFEDTVWRHLVDEHGADEAAFPDHGPARRMPRRAAATGIVAGVGALAAAGVLVLGGTTDTPPAYALTRHADGSYTLTLNDLTTGVRAVNARLAALRIDTTVIPVRSGCARTPGVPMVAPIPGRAGGHGLLPTANARTTITLRQTPRLPARLHAYIAAERQPDGRVTLAQGWTRAKLPTCLPRIAG